MLVGGGNMSESVVLVPGLGIGGSEFFLLGSRLRKLGYNVTVFRHFPLCGSFEDKSKALASVVNKIDSPKIHFLGHSMGGLIILDFLNRNQHVQTGRIVLLGSPVNGSLATRRILKIPFGRLLLGKCMVTACSGKYPPFPHNREIGSIAGKINFILGWLLWLQRPNDSLIAVQETQHSDMMDTSVLSVTHTSMLFSSNVIKKINSFFQTCTFSSNEAL